MKAFDISKFRKSITKSIEGLGIGFNDPKDWISTGNYALNYLISGDFEKGIPLGKVTVFAGESGCLPSSATVTIRTQDRVPRTVTVEELKHLRVSDQYQIEINTPDGFQKIGNWFDKGVMKMVMIITATNRTVCARKHLIQLENGSWKMAGKLEEGDMVQTINGIEPVTAIIEDLDSEECFDFEILHPNHRYWGDGFSSHNSGKSFICSGNIVKHAQLQGIFVVLIDSENALDEKWLNDLGVDTSEDKLIKLNMAMIDDVAKTISEFMSSYKELPEEERPKVLFVVDSLGMLLTPTDVDQFDKGDLKGDMGRKPKALAALVRNCVNMFGSYNVGMVCTNHTYASQDMFDPDDKVSGGQGFVYASSVLVAMKKLKLKEDEDGNKITDIRGIRSACKVIKTRYSKPFESVQVKIPYDTGMSPTSGLVDLFEGKGLLKKDGNSLKYVTAEGEVIKKFRKAWERNENDCLHVIMREVMNNQSCENTQAHSDENMEIDQDGES